MAATEGIVFLAARLAMASHAGPGAAVVAVAFNVWAAFVTVIATGFPVLRRRFAGSGRGRIIFLE